MIYSVMWCMWGTNGRGYDWIKYEARCCTCNALKWFWLLWALKRNNEKSCRFFAAIIGDRGLLYWTYGDRMTRVEDFAFICLFSFLFSTLTTFHFSITQSTTYLVREPISKVTLLLREFSLFLTSLTRIFSLEFSLFLTFFTRIFSLIYAILGSLSCRNHKYLAMISNTVCSYYKYADFWWISLSTYITMECDRVLALVYIGRSLWQIWYS